MGKIVAIGGGEIGRAGYSIETTRIDREIIRLSGKTEPKLLFIPTASSDSESYFGDVKRHFGKRLGCRVDVLYLIREKPSRQDIEKKILSSDIVYVGGGNTLKMLGVWKKTGTDRILRKAHERGIVLSGVSAGAMCWFKYGSSDTRKFYKKGAGLVRIRGLGLVDASFCPHYNEERDRKPHVKSMMRKTPGVVLALENCSAIEIADGKFRIISSKKAANAYKVYWEKGKFRHEKIPKRKDFLPLGILTGKLEPS
jgi:dipeptidase E